MGNPCPVQRDALDDVAMSGAKEEDLAEDVSGIMGSQDTLVISHSNGVFHHHIQWWCLPRIRPPSHPTFQAWSNFRPVSSAPRPLALLMCLTILTWMPWNAKTAGWSFFQS